MTDLHQALGLEGRQMNTTIAAELDEIAEDEAPKRRGRPAIAFAAEPIPAEIDAAFLEDLAFERAISTALGLSGPVGGLSGISGPMTPPDSPAAVLGPEEASL